MAGGKSVQFDISAEDKTKAAFSSVRKSVGDVTGSIFSLQTAIGGIGIGLFTQQIMEAGIAMQRIENALKAATGSAEGAGRELSFVRAEAQRLGLELETASKSFVTIAASAKGTALEGQGVRDIFTSVSEASTVLGLTADETQGALLAISQMMSKGKVSAEELRGQLGERLPGAFQTAAKAMGVSTMKLDEMLKAGELMADDFLPKFATELRKTFAEGLPDAVNSAQANLNRFKNDLFEIKAKIAGSGFMDGVVVALGRISAEIDTPEFHESLKQLGQGLGEIAANLGTIAAIGAKAVGVFAEIAKYAGLESVSRTYVEGLKLIEQGYLDQQKFVAASSMERQEMVLAAYKKMQLEAKSMGLIYGPTKVVDNIMPEGTLAAEYDKGKSNGGVASGGKESQKFSDELQSLSDKLLAEEDLIFQSAVRREQSYKEALENKKITEEEYRALSFESELVYSQQNDEIKAAEEQKRIESEATLQDAIDEIRQRVTERNTEQLESLTEYLYTEEEAVWASYERRFDMLVELEEKKAITKEQFYDYEARLADKAQRDLSTSERTWLFDREKYEKLYLKNKAQFTFAALAEMTAGFAQHNKTLFAINKAARMAEATMELAAGVSNTLNSYKYPLNLVMAAAHAAIGATYIAQIAASNFSDTASSGISAGSYGAGTPSSPVITQPSYDRPVYDSGLSLEERSMSQQINVYIDGNVVGNDAWVRDDLIPAIQKAARDGVTQ